MIRPSRPPAPPPADDLRIARIGRYLATGDPADGLAALAAILLLGPVHYAGRLWTEDAAPGRRRMRRGRAR